MEQLEMLWAYQQEDIKADKIALDIRRSPKRQQLEKKRDFIMEQQKLFKQLDEKIAAMADRMDMIRHAIPRCEEQLKQLTERAEQNPPADLEAVRALIAEVNACRTTIADYENEMRRIVKDSSEHMNRQRSIRLEAAKVKVEFDQMKASYDSELQEQKKLLDAQREIAKQKAEGIDPQLLEQYNTIKKHISPPMSRLMSDQCGGCNTALPSAALRKIKNGEILECETCGRMIIL